MFTRIIKIKEEKASHDPKADFSLARMKQIFLDLKSLKKGKKDRTSWEFLSKEIKSLREELKENLISVDMLVFKNKNYQFYYWIDNSAVRLVPRKKEEKVKDYLKNKYKCFYDAWDQYKQEIKNKRSELKSVKYQTKECLGFSYKMIGDVFEKKNSIIALQTVENQMVRISKPKKPVDSQKSNYIGIELELIAKVNREKLNEILCKHFLAGYVHVKHDGSIQKESTKDFDHEVTLLCKESDVKTVVTKLCSVLNSQEVDAYVNNSCGLHVHLDCRNRNVKHVYNNLVKTLPLLKNMVPKSRIESSHAERYCKMNKTSVFDEAGSDRYTAVNGPDAYSKYKTVEVRMHSGSVNAAKIINWVTILTSVVNISTTLSIYIENVKQYKSITGCSDKLVEYIEKRIEKFTGKEANGFDTRSDHFFFQEVEVAI